MNKSLYIFLISFMLGMIWGFSSELNKKPELIIKDNCYDCYDCYDIAPSNEPISVTLPYEESKFVIELNNTQKDICSHDLLEIPLEQNQDVEFRIDNKISFKNSKGNEIANIDSYGRATFNEIYTHDLHVGQFVLMQDDEGDLVVVNANGEHTKLANGG